MLRLAILEADSTIPAVAERRGSYADIFTALLTSAGLTADSCNYKAYHVVDQVDNYPALDDVDAILITGSRHNSYDNIPWINRLVEYVQQALATNRIRVVGICFGHQIIGRALGAKVGPNEGGWEVSASVAQLTPEGARVFEGLEGNQMSIMQMHRDIVHSVPEGTQLLAHNAQCAVQGLYKPGALLSLQGHPEFTDDIETDLIQTRKATGAFPPDNANEYLARVHNRNDGPTLAKAIVRFVNGHL